MGGPAGRPSHRAAEGVAVWGAVEAGQGAGEAASGQTAAVEAAVGEAAAVAAPPGPMCELLAGPPPWLRSALTQHTCGWGEAGWRQAGKLTLLRRGATRS